MQWQSAPVIAVPATSNGSESDDIQFEIIKLLIIVHLLEESLHLFHRECDALLCCNLHHAADGGIRVCSHQPEQLPLHRGGHPITQCLELVERCQQGNCSVSPF